MIPGPRPFSLNTHEDRLQIRLGVRLLVADNVMALAPALVGNVGP
jgi:hypothetical protein